MGSDSAYGLTEERRCTVRKDDQVALRSAVRCQQDVLKHRRFCARGGSPGRGIWSKERIVAGCRNEDCFEFIASASSNLPFILYQLRSNSGAIGADGPSKARYPKRFRNGILRRHTRGRANGPARIGPSQIRGTLPHFSSRRRARAFSLLRSGFATWGPKALSPRWRVRRARTIEDREGSRIVACRGEFVRRKLRHRSRLKASNVSSGRNDRERSTRCVLESAHPREQGPGSLSVQRTFG
jgi:hypothetical protein